MKLKNKNLANNLWILGYCKDEKVCRVCSEIVPFEETMQGVTICDAEVMSYLAELAVNDFEDELAKILYDLQPEKLYVCVGRQKFIMLDYFGWKYQFVNGRIEGLISPEE